MLFVPSIPFVILAMEDDNDRHFMTSFYYKYKRLMYSEAIKTLQNQCDPEDVVQASLVKLIEKVSLLRSMDERARVNYMITTIKHTAISALRDLRPGKLNSIDDEDWLEGRQLHADGSLEEDVFRRENIDRMASIWGLLDKRSQYLLQARYFLDKKQDEIAAELNIKPDSVRMEMSRARKKVRELLAEKYDMKDLWS